jgi:hypothetical protein
MIKTTKDKLPRTAEEQHNAYQENTISMRTIKMIAGPIGEMTYHYTLLLCFMITMSNLHSQTAPQYFNAAMANFANSRPLNSLIDNRVQWLYAPGAFNLGGTTGNPAPMAVIDAIAFRLGSNPSGASVYQDFTIKLSQNVGTITSWSDPLFVSGMDTVFYMPTYSLVNPVGGQWHKIPLQQGFFYNPTQSLVVEICVSGGTGNTLLQPAFTTAVQVQRYGNYSSPSGTTATAVIDFGFDMSPGITDAGLQGFVNLQDTMCAGTLPVEVTLKNYGQSILNTVQIAWEVNQILQPPISWTGSLSPNGTAAVTLGHYGFQTGISYQVRAWTHSPNQLSDTINHNDTATAPEIVFTPSPQYHLTDTLVVICQGDTAWLSGTLSGVPPWDLVVTDGTTQIAWTNLTTPSFTFPLAPTATKIYSLVSLIDVTGCITSTGQSFAVSVQQSPPAIITPVGSPAACDGDSVILMASVGLNFSYQWFLDSILMPGVTGHTIAAKSSGNYTTTVNTPAGCSNTSQPVTVTIHSSPMVFLGNDTTLLPHQHITVDAGAGFNSYLWSTGEGTQTINIDSAGTGIGVKTVWVQVTDNNSCKGGDTILITFTPDPGIAGVNGDASVQIFPNPTTGMVTMNISQLHSEYFILKIYGTDGRLVYTVNMAGSEIDQEVQLNLNHLPDGIYLIKITSTHETLSSTHKVIINRKH